MQPVLEAGPGDHKVHSKDDAGQQSLRQLGDDLRAPECLDIANSGFRQLVLPFDSSQSSSACGSRWKSGDMGNALRKLTLFSKAYRKPPNRLANTRSATRATASMCVARSSLIKHLLSLGDSSAHGPR